MDYHVSTQDTFLSVITLTSTQPEDKVILLDADIEITESAIISIPVIIDLNSHALSISVSEGISVCNCAVSFQNGKINCNVADAIVTNKSDASVLFGKNLDVEAVSGAIHIKGRSKIVVDGAHIHADCEDSPIDVEGFSLAKDNSSLTMVCGGIQNDSGHCIFIHKGGSFTMCGGKLSSNTSAILDDKNRTVIELMGGEIHESASSSVSSNINPETVEPAVELIAETTEQIEKQAEQEQLAEEPEKTEEKPKKDVKQTESDHMLPKSRKLLKSTIVYGVPDGRMICRYIGSVVVLSEGHKSTSGKEYSYIKFVVPGSGKRCRGYILSSALQ